MCVAPLPINRPFYFISWFKLVVGIKAVENVSTASNLMYIQDSIGAFERSCIPILAPAKRVKERSIK
jgi:hypothetical protein